MKIRVPCEIFVKTPDCFGNFSWYFTMAFKKPSCLGFICSERSSSLSALRKHAMRRITCHIEPVIGESGSKSLKISGRCCINGILSKVILFTSSGRFLMKDSGNSSLQSSMILSSVAPGHGWALSYNKTHQLGICQACLYLFKLEKGGCDTSWLANKKIQGSVTNHVCNLVTSSTSYVFLCISLLPH